jgi:hypothetical protein
LEKAIFPSFRGGILGSKLQLVGSNPELWLFHIQGAMPSYTFNVDFYKPTSLDNLNLVGQTSFSFPYSDPNTLIIGSMAVGNNVSLDEIRIGTELTDVMTPEPASLAAIGIGLAGLWRARRRKKL